MKLRAILALAVAAFAALFVAPGAHAATTLYPVNQCASLSVSTTNPLPGETITVSGTNFTPNASVRLELHSSVIVLGTVKADAQGSFTTTVKLPSNLTGTHVIFAATGFDPLGGQCVPSASLGIQPGSTNTPPPGGTSFTGVDILAMVLGAVALLGIGYALNRSGKRRHTYANDIG
jgi:hypothetical protein